jgi:hypothetical protein
MAMAVSTPFYDQAAHRPTRFRINRCSLPHIERGNIFSHGRKDDRDSGFSFRFSILAQQEPTQGVVAWIVLAVVSRLLKAVGVILPESFPPAEKLGFEIRLQNSC